MPILIEARALGKAYGSRQVLHGIDLVVPAGQVFILLGGNGAGKTALLNLLAGLLPPDGGSILLNGHDLLAERSLALPQVAAWPELPRWNDEQPVGERLPLPEGPAAPFLRALDLERYRGQAGHTLSGGQRRQVLLAQFLAGDRPILLLDEPFCGLDERSVRTLCAWIQHLAHAQARAVVVATSDPHLALDLGDRLVLLRDGRIAADLRLDQPPRLDQPACYRIRVRGRLEARWSAWFDGLAMTTREDETLLAGLVMDQPALHSLLTRIRDLGLVLLSVERFEAGLGEILHD